MLSKAAARDMRKRKYGRIVNIASMSALVVNKGVHGGSYEVSKAAVLMLTRTLAAEWAKDGICVNAICPGYYLTDPNKEFFAKDPAFHRNVIEMIPAGRLGELHELGGALLLLCSGAASYMHGTAITVDGGYTLW
jgi:gluconate 5-dehydrogenase